MSIDGAIQGCFGFISVMFHMVSDGDLCFTNILFVTDGAFQEVDCSSGVKGKDVKYCKVFFCLVGRIMALAAELRKSSTLFMMTRNALCWKAGWSWNGGWNICIAVIIEFGSN